MVEGAPRDLRCGRLMVTTPRPLQGRASFLIYPGCRSPRLPNPGLCSCATSGHGCHPNDSRVDVMEPSVSFTIRISRSFQTQGVSLVPRHENSSLAHGVPHQAQSLFRSPQKAAVPRMVDTSIRISPHADVAHQSNAAATSLARAASSRGDVHTQSEQGLHMCHMGP